MIGAVIGIIGSFILCIIIMRTQMTEIHNLRQGNCKEVHMVDIFLPDKNISNEPTINDLQKIVEQLQ